jgi:hypothetical protein
VQSLQTHQKLLNMRLQIGKLKAMDDYDLASITRSQEARLAAL